MKIMAKRSLLAGLMGAIFLTAIFPMTAFARVPEMITYQGMLTDAVGTAVVPTFIMNMAFVRHCAPHRWMTVGS